MPLTPPPQAKPADAGLLMPQPARHRVRRLAPWRQAGVAWLLACATGLALAQATAAGAPPAAAASDKANDFSAAERLIFMAPQLNNIKPPTTLRYQLRQSGTLEAGFQDSASLALTAGANGRCCATHTEYLSAARKVSLPDLPTAEANPVILHFLEREVREMNRLTKGSQYHFRKRIRMAVFEGATIQPITLQFKGRAVAGQAVEIRPYLDDPNRPRYESLARKTYRFLLSEAVPGWLFGIQAWVPGAEPAAPWLQLEELFLDGAEPPPRSAALSNAPRTPTP